MIFKLRCSIYIGLNVSSPLESKMTNDNASEEVIYIGTVVRHGLMTRKLFMVTFVTNLHALSSAHSIKNHRNEKHNLEVHIKNKPSSFKIDDMVAYRKYSTNSRDNFNIGVITVSFVTHYECHRQNNQCKMPDFHGKSSFGFLIKRILNITINHKLYGNLEYNYKDLS